MKGPNLSAWAIGHPALIRYLNNSNFSPDSVDAKHLLGADGGDYGWIVGSDDSGPVGAAGHVWAWFKARPPGS